uniref:Small ribosomal subunit protein uS11c n=1 Tax=Arachnitis uniflora TaxID=191246 RepID=A0A0K1H2H5_9LILI|nr:ribosomal protein S11 [Arachnitis uniflora]
MTKLIQKKSLHKNRYKIQKRVIIYIQISLNNIIITVTDMWGQAILWTSSGAYGFKGPKRGTPYAAQATVRNFIGLLVYRGIRQAEVMIKGPGPGRDAALRTFYRSQISLNFVCDITPTAHNGCRPPKKKRV